MRAIAETSRDAYRAFIASPKLSAQQRIIVDLLATHRGGYTRGEIAEATGLRLSSVCGRTRELLDAGQLEEFARRPCSVTGIGAHVLRLAPAQRALFD